VSFSTTDELGAPSDVKEAIAFALIGYLSAHGLPGNVPSCTGASGPGILGTITVGALVVEVVEAVEAGVPEPERLLLVSDRD